MAADYEEKAAEKRRLQAESIPSEWRLDSIPSISDAPNALDFIRSSSLLSHGELETTETADAKVLLQKLATQELSSVEVVTAFSKRAALAHQLTICCTEMFFDEALEQARELDEYLEKNGRTVGPLHGLPVSIKDQFDIKGVDSSIGMSLRSLNLRYKEL